MQRIAGRTAAWVAVLLLPAGCGHSADYRAADAPRIQLNFVPSQAATIDITGLPAAALSDLRRQAPTGEEWTELLRITVAGPPAIVKRPAVLGTYDIVDNTLRFTPQFPLDRGQRYHVRFDPAHLPAEWGGGADWARLPQLDATVELPAAARGAATHVVEVYPTAAEVPENQLRLYVLFSAPMTPSGGLEHVRLLDEGGQPIVDPFIPLDLDLWNEDRTRFTLLFDPGRVKTGILPNEQMGRALVSGRRYTLAVDADWADAAGQPLAAPFRREFRVGPPQETALNPAQWRLDPPRGGTLAPLVLSFPQPLDYGLLRRAIRVARGDGQPVDGDIQLGAGEIRWLFTPRTPWSSGDYQLVAASTLEDVAGNRIGKAFEVDARTSAANASRPQSVAIPFRITESRH
jgi:hypothetical protein